MEKLCVAFLSILPLYINAQTIQPTAVVVQGYQKVTISGITSTSLPTSASFIVSENGTTRATQAVSSCTVESSTVVCPLNFTISTLLPSGYTIPATGGTELSELDFELQYNGGSYALKVYTPPTIDPSPDRIFAIWTTHMLEVSGINLNLDGNIRAVDYAITVGGDVTCDIQSLTATALSCHLPQTIPSADASGRSAKVVHLGAYSFTERQFTYRIPQFVRSNTTLYDYDPSGDDKVRVDGEFLMVGVNSTDYFVLIGQGQATVNYVGPSYMKFTPPSTAPAPANSTIAALNGNLPQIVIFVPRDKLAAGSKYQYVYHVGYVNYLSSSTGTDTGSTNTGSGTSGSGTSGSGSGTSGSGSAATNSGSNPVLSLPDSSADSNTGSGDDDDNSLVIGVGVAFGALGCLALLGILICCCARADVMGLRKKYRKNEDDFRQEFVREPRPYYPQSWYDYYNRPSNQLYTIGETRLGRGRLY